MTVPLPPRVRLMRRIFLAAITTSAVLLLPWTVYLAFHLPTRHSARHWNLAWVGFDVALLLLLSATAAAAWQRRQLVVPLAMVTATFLVLDAWFDIVLDWGTSDVWWSIASAVLLELPLAAFLLGAARRIITVLVLNAWERGGNDGPAPRLRQVRITQLIDVVVYARDPGSR